ncbi:HNH endonuclease signature motif containing protein [Mycolicibacter longobardus]|uniref:HNH nuclease domain-containing protein n=1 Tax=Mycolicibacter longobardus TaxID=1108812 RepID=A0A1X1YNM4_9MYCO|nr:HNH endonuclease signature motif containing protein [Mycolicibacter longobardus]MCV7384198.1 DUF222 domain-containing protein [Mycolicibacter longobardus]ORW12707.1 hypothetical protein AWC16_05920 [Mycolicibacter longobardus]
MFDTKDLDLAELASADDGAVAASVAGWARIEAAAAARRLAAIAELVRRRTDISADRAHWACDEWDGAAAEVAAALGVSHAKASRQMYLALALRERLPRVAQLFAEGRLSAQLVSVISWHTTLINDPDALRQVDAEVAAEARRYERMSAPKTAQAIDAIVDRHDPAALRRTRDAARSREVVIDRSSDIQTGTTALWGRLYAADAEVLERRLMAMAHEVCPDDPRTLAQRRADALGALAAGGDRLVCGCGNTACAAADPGERRSGVIIHVLAEQASVQTPVDPRNHGQDPDPEPDPDPDPAVSAPPAVILGGPLVPAPLLAELIAAGATIRPLIIPGPDTLAEPRYRPSTALDEFVRCRDMTCRFPGCDRPAEFCDIDHAIAYPWGPTHPCNLRCLCRKHHLLKTFWGWRDQQFPDGTITWTSPSGQSFTTHPGSRRQFPVLCLPTGELPQRTEAPPTTANRTLMMPARRRTRAQDRAQRINAERALNADYAAERIAERNQPPPF